MEAELRIEQTSADCCRYTLVAAGVIIWRNRVYATPAGHKGARERMAAWALAHHITVVEAATAPHPAALATKAPHRS